MDSNTKYLIGLIHFLKFGPKRTKRLKNKFNDFEKAFFANTVEIIKAGIEEKIALEFKAFKNNFDLDFFIKKYEEEDIQTVTLDQKEYPSLLKEIYDPPPILFYKGSIECLSKPTLSVVGSRKFTSYGRQVTEDIVYSLAKNNLVIVSGLALGIDALAHFATLNANGITVAVLGSGVNNSSIYPVTNLKLSKRIIETGGAVISEFPFGTPGFRQNFPQRNRVIAGLSSGTLVIEGHEKSGSLITARCALESGREIFAIPGSIYSFSSAGTNKLIHDGAHLVTKAEDILENFCFKNIPIKKIDKKLIPDNNIEELILSFLTKEPTHINRLINLSKLDTKIINSTLTIMEMKGMIKNLGNMMYIIK